MMHDQRTRTTVRAHYSRFSARNGVRPNEEQRDTGVAVYHLKVGFRFPRQWAVRLRQE